MKIQELIQEMAYPKTFNMEEFKNIKSFKKRLEYSNTHLPRKLGSGSARTVFQIDDEKVLKLAHNNKGYHQNQIEEDFYLQGFDIIAKVFDFDEDNHTYLEMELAKKITKKRFKQLVGVSLEDVWNYLYNLRIQYNLTGVSRYDRIKEVPEDIEENSFIQELKDIVLSYDMQVPGDFGRESTYGEVMRDGQPTVVIIDFGLTNRVYDDFYKRV
jgi:hypothetical protein